MPLEKSKHSLRALIIVPVVFEELAQISLSKKRNWLAKEMRENSLGAVLSYETILDFVPAFE